MRLVDFPIGLPINGLAPIGGPAVLGSTESSEGFAQVVSNPFQSGVSFTVSVGKMRDGMARAFTRLSVSAKSGANCFRFPFFDPDEPSFEELGLDFTTDPVDQLQPWSNGLGWAHGPYWRAGKPTPSVTAASAKNSDTITFDASEWNGVIPTWIGVVGHFAVYGVTGVTFSGDEAAVRVWPPVRKAITTADYVTMRPVLCATVTGADGAPWSRGEAFIQGAQLKIREVPDEVVRAYVTEDFG